MLTLTLFSIWVVLVFAAIALNRNESASGKYSKKRGKLYKVIEHPTEIFVSQSLYTGEDYSSPDIIVTEHNFKKIQRHILSGNSKKYKAIVSR